MLVVADSGLLWCCYCDGWVGPCKMMINRVVALLTCFRIFSIYG